MAPRARSTSPVEGSATPAASRVRAMAGRGGRFVVQFDARPVYDFVISLTTSMWDSVEVPAADRHWLQEAHAALPARLRSSDLIGRPERDGDAMEVFPIVVEHPEVRTAAGLVAQLERMPDHEIVAATVPHEDEAELRPVVTAVLAGERPPEDLDQAMARLDTDRSAEFLAAVRDPHGAAEALREVFRFWLSPFQDVEDRVARAQGRDVAARENDRATLSSDELIERATGGVRVVAGGEIDRVVLAPSYFSRPFNYWSGGGNWRLFCYPLADSALGEVEAAGPPAATIRLYRALGDESRLRILRLLADRDMYLTEIAQQLELSKPTVSHHLAQLRAAGLVTITEQGALTYYSLRRQRVDEASVELRSYLG